MFRYLISNSGCYPDIRENKVQATKPSNGMIGEIRLTPLTKLMNGWVYCDGRKLNIQEFWDLHSVIGTTYGGDGKTTFAVPNLDKLTEKMKKMKKAIAAKKAAIKAAIAAKEYYGQLSNELMVLEESYAMGRAVAGDQLGKGKLRYVICTMGEYPNRNRATTKRERKMTINRERYLAEVMLFAGSFEPHNWSFCDGTSMNIQLHESLYSLIGTNYHSTGIFGYSRQHEPKNPGSFNLPNFWRAEAELAKAAGLKSAITMEDQGKGKGLRYLIQMTGGYYPPRR